MFNYVQSNQQNSSVYPSANPCGKAPLKAVVSKFNASIIMDTENNASYDNVKKAIGQAAIKGARGIYQQ